MLLSEYPARFKREKVYPVQRRKVSGITKVILALDPACFICENLGAVETRSKPVVQGPTRI
jgi:hypothetical protein